MANARAHKNAKKNSSSKLDHGRPKAGGPVKANVSIPKPKPAVKPAKAASFGKKMAAKKPPVSKPKDTKPPKAAKTKPAKTKASKVGDGATGGSTASSASTKAVAKDLTKSKPSAYATKAPVTGKALTAAGKSEASATHDKLPKFSAKMPGEGGALKKGKKTKPKADAKIDKGAKGPDAKAPKLAKEKPAKAKVAKVGAKSMKGLGKETPAEQVQANFQAAVDGVATESGVNTNPGPAPDVRLSGKSDPVRAIRQDDSSDAKMDKALQEQWKAIDKGPGPQDVQRVAIDEQFEPAKVDMPAIAEVNQSPKMDEYMAAGVPDTVRAKSDDIMAPSFLGNLTKAEAEFDKAVAKRDADRDSAIADAEQSVEQANKDAQKAQEKEVAAARKDIQKGQAETKKKQAKELAKAKRKSDKEKKRVEKSIAKKTADTDKKVDKKFAEGKKKAEAKKRSAEAKAARKKKEAEKKKENMSWWERATSAIGNFLDSLCDVIGGIFDTLSKAVGGILNAVKDYAMKAIDAAVSFASKALDLFGDFLKGLVTNLLGSVFPGLAKALNELIDKVVAASKNAIKKFGEGLKKAVAAALDGLNKVLQKVLEVAKVAMTTALTVAAAAVTGDWERAFRALLEGALQVAGISPEQFYGFVGKGMDTIKAIVNDPGKFIGNLIKAMAQGFKQFSKNFVKHLMGGIVGWLTGQMKSTGLRLPKNWDAAGIFDLVMQIAGIGKEQLLAKVEKKVGKKNMDRVKWVWDKIETLISQGISGIWDQIAGFVGNLWDTALSAISGFIEQKVVIAAVTKIASMFTPVGAIVQALITAWNVYQFIKAQAAKIMGIIKGIVDSIAAIVAGQIGGAAGHIEKSLAKAIPVAIDLLARVLGLGGIGKKVKEVLGGFQKKISAAIDKFIDKIWAKGKKVVDQVSGKDGKDDKAKEDGKGDGASKPDVSKLPSPILATKKGTYEVSWIDDKGQPRMQAAKTFAGPVRAKSLPAVEKAFQALPDNAVKKQRAENLKHAKNTAMTTESKARKWYEAGGKDQAPVKSSADLFGNHLFEVMDYLAQAEGAEFPDPTSFKAGGENHKVYVEVRKGEPEVMVASKPKKLADRIVEWKPWIDTLAEGDRGAVQSALGKAQAYEAQTEGLEDKVQAGDKAALAKLEGLQDKISLELRTVFKHMPDEQVKVAVAGTLESDSYKNFVKQIEAMNKDFPLDIDAKKAAENTWLALIGTLYRLEAGYATLPVDRDKAGKPKDGRQKLSSQAYKEMVDDLDPVVDALNAWMNSQLAKSPAKTWAFWSGNPAKAVAMTSGGMVLEASALGRLFESRMTGVTLESSAQFVLWGALSRAYAKRAAEDVKSRKYLGFVGEGAGAEQSVFNQIENPTFFGLTGKNLAIEVDAIWHACAGKIEDEEPWAPDPRYTGGGLPGTYAKKKEDRMAMVDLVTKKAAERREAAAGNA